MDGLDLMKYELDQRVADLIEDFRKEYGKEGSSWEWLSTCQRIVIFLQKISIKNVISRSDIDAEVHSFWRKVYNFRSTYEFTPFEDMTLRLIENYLYNLQLDIV